MGKPLSTPDQIRGGSKNGTYQARYSLDDAPRIPQEVTEELELLRSENSQLRILCGELEQALHEATQLTGDAAAAEDRLREYEQMMEEKSETIRHLHQQLQEAQALLEEAENKAQEQPRHTGPVPREEELLSLSEELERERKQLQEDEQSLMEQMRQMEMSMARERAEMARQRNDLQRLYGEIRHELERLERNGALQNKMDELKAKLQDASTRRGAAPASGSFARPATQSALPSMPQQPQQPPQGAPTKGSFMGRLFGNK